MLSLCMIVKDEATMLPRCLASVSGLADEIVVVDTGSTDGTVAIAHSHGATVHHHDFTDVDFAAARNRALDLARGEFALVLDADEELHPASVATVRRLAEGPTDTGYIVTRRNRHPGRTAPAGTDHAVRLFPLHPRYRYRHRVHETVDDAILQAGGRLCRSDIVLDHFLPAVPRQREKSRFYLGLLRRDLAHAPDDVDRLTFLAAEYHKLGDFAAATSTAEHIAALCPDDFTAQFTVALYHYAYGDDPARARTPAAAALRLRPADPDAAHLWAQLHRTP